MGLCEGIHFNTLIFTAGFFSVKEQGFPFIKVWFSVCPFDKDQRSQVFGYPLTSGKDSSSVNLTSILSL